MLEKQQREAVKITQRITQRKEEIESRNKRKNELSNEIRIVEDDKDMLGEELDAK